MANVVTSNSRQNTILLGYVAVSLGLATQRYIPQICIIIHIDIENRSPAMLNVATKYNTVNKGEIFTEKYVTYKPRKIKQYLNSDNNLNIKLWNKMDQ
jgi:hypothetical protein